MLNSNDSSWSPTIFIGNQKVRVNPTPRLLGVILDRSLTFNTNLKKLTTSLASSIRIIRATAHTWGWRRSTLKMAFHALVRSKLDTVALASRHQPFQFRSSPEPFYSTHHWSTRLYSARSRCSELPNLQQTLDTKG